MPMYAFHCAAGCGHKQIEYRPMKHSAAPQQCDRCQETMVRDFGEETVNTPMEEFFKPIQMHSIALCHHDDIVDFKKRHPDVECSHDPDHPLYGVPIAKSRHEKLGILRKEGWQEKN